MSVVFSLLCVNELQVPASLAAALQSELVKSMLDERVEETSVIPLLEIKNVDLFHLLIEWCEYHVQDPCQVYTGDNTRGKRFHEIVCTYDQLFLNGLSKPDLIEMLKMSEYMQIETLTSLLMYFIANYIKETDISQLKEWLEITVDITNEEEYEIRRRYPGVFSPNKI